MPKDKRDPAKRLDGTPRLMAADHFTNKGGCKHRDTNPGLTTGKGRGGCSGR